MINTRNEAGRLPSLLATVADFDEVVVGDMASEDDTVALAHAAGATVIELPNAGFCEPGRMPTIRASTTEWVLVLDADERLVDGAIPHLRRLLDATPAGVAAYRLPRRNHVGKRAIRGSGWGLPHELHARLFRRDSVSWPPVIHAEPSFDGEVLDLPGDGPIQIHHDNFDDVEHLLAKLNHYTTIEAESLLREGLEPSLPMALRFGLEEIVHRYDPEADGSLSLVLSLAMFSYRFDLAAKASELRGWPDDVVIARSSMIAAVNAMWNELRSRELSRSLDATGDDEARAEALRAANHVWAAMPPTLSDRTVVLGPGAEEPEGPWRELRADELGRRARLVEQVVQAQVDRRRARRLLEEVRARLDQAEEDAAEAKSYLEALAPVVERSAAEVRDRDLELARYQARIAELEATGHAPPSLRRVARELIALIRRAR